MRRRFLRLCISVVVSNALAGLVVLFWAWSHKREFDALRENYAKTAALNTELTGKLAQQLSVNSNMVQFVYYCYNNRTNDIAAIVASMAPQIGSNQAQPALEAQQKNTPPNKPRLPVDFRHYCIVNGVPSVYVGSTRFTVGDSLNGRVIDSISPSAVEIDGEYYNVQ